MEEKNAGKGCCLKDLIDKVENNENILRFRFKYKNTLVWPFIRFSVYRGITDRFFNATSNNLKGINNLQAIVKQVLQGLRLSMKTPFLWERKDCLFYYSSLGNIIDFDGAVQNRIYGNFVEEFKERSGVIETVGSKKYIKDNHVDKRYMDFITLLIQVLCFACKPYEEDVLMANALMDYLRNECMLEISPNDAVIIKKNIIYFSKQIRFCDRIFPHVFSAIRPKVVFVETGCYGDQRAYLNRLLHDMGVKTVEVQHGWIGINHEAYVHSQVLCDNPEYASYMPDFFLGYSDYWLDKITIPGAKIPIGNPWFWHQYSSYMEKAKSVKEKQRNCKTILWLPFLNHDKSLEVLDEFINQSNNEYSIRVRLHPNFKYLKSEYQKYEQNTQIILDDLPTVYDSLQVSDYVISDHSTVVYEALAVGKQTYVYECEVSFFYEMIEVAPTFKNANELLDLLHSNNNDIRVARNDAVIFFGENWKDKFRNFMDDLLTDGSTE